MAYALLADGTETLKYRGILLQIVDEWDIRIAGSFTTAGGVSDLPHRALITQFGNLQLGFDAQPFESEVGGALSVWTNQDTEKWNARTKYVADAQIANKGLVAVAY